MEEMPDIAITCPYTIRGSDYIISLECKDNDSMTVQVEDRSTSDQWRSSFESQYVEDLTHKTGNFKQFTIFVHMLESAITKSSESVSLDLLTYSDLEALRQKKSGHFTSDKSSLPSSRSNHLISKRYLILTYTVEFDRIHYPLPLPYVGKPDPQALQEEIRQLRAELKHARSQHPPSDNRADKLLKDYRRLEREKNEVEQEFAAFRREVRIATGSNAVKDIRALKTMVKNLEEQLMKEKTHYQRTTSKRSQEYRDLLEEVEELRASERNLRVRVKSLTNELALLKRGRTLTRTSSKERNGSGDRVSNSRTITSSRQRSLSNDRITGRSGSRDRLRHGSSERPPIHRSNSTEHLIRSSLNGSGLRRRSNSLDRNTSANQSHFSIGSGSNRSRTPSPAGGRRFNPTEYVKEKARKQKEADFKKRRQQRGNNSGLSSRSRQSNNSSKLSGSQSNASDGYGSDGSYTKTRPGSGGSGRPRSLKTQEDSPIGLPRAKALRPPNGKTAKQLSSTPDMAFLKTKTRLKPTLPPDSGDEDSEYFDRSAEISEIDERLDRLQQLMKATMP
ncbi:centrosomal protein CCDC61-like isoform X2 [Physella acuta]|uniref:centrosomal protein CCDC61-like isoform X2 n=1 Tax=Physella acuta TaxID=109671 RepID=UPI0027DBE980|nr:centrosomal protein CCDC61-like isoform X2 [Physella acuta]